METSKVSNVGPLLADLFTQSLSFNALKCNCLARLTVSHKLARFGSVRIEFSSVKGWSGRVGVLGGKPVSFCGSTFSFQLLARKMTSGKHCLHASDYEWRMAKQITAHNDYKNKQINYPHRGVAHLKAI